MKDCTHLILIADDDPDDRELISFAFSKVDPSLRLCLFKDGKEALEYLWGVADNFLPCIILLDYNMPELNGAQVIQQLLSDQRFESIPKIILSTSDNPLFIHDAISNGADAYKVKPSDFGELLGIAKEMAALCKSAA